MRKIILASNSPRRKELLESVHIPFEIIGSDVEEVFDKTLSIEKALEQVALSKAKKIAEANSDAIVIGADTIVYHHGTILGKPKSLEDAYDTLKKLSGDVHQVITGVALCFQGEVELFHSVSEVCFYTLSDEDIKTYLTLEPPLDKAGSYGIQGMGKYFVKELHGDYFNIVGLPVAELYQRLKKYV
ncbi:MULTISPECIES: Maf family protein [unclassified Breznakia]|uniref:Maf family protein n=1 Tax=unclassified Breznakia TaxID=2623764 RepID=UPI0024069231|nr:MULTISPECIES: Maf family protein [unclassified Breznakia]